MNRVGLCCFLWILPISLAMGGSDEDLQDLSGQVIPMVSSLQGNALVAGGELFSKGNLSSRSDIQYSVQVKNQTGDPVIGSSLILVIEQVMDMDQTRDVTNRLEFLGADGHTEKGKSFFHVPTGTAQDLAPYGISEPILVHIRNPDLLALSPPTFSLFGIRRTENKRVEDLRKALIEKGILSPDEAAEILGTPSPDTP